MPRGTAQDYYDGRPYESVYRDRPPGQSRRERLIEDDLDYPNRNSSVPVEEVERLRIRERSAPGFHRDDLSPRRHSRRPSPRRIPRDIERDDRGRYVEAYSDDDDEHVRKGGWPATPAGYDTDEEGPSGWDRRRRRRDTRSQPETEYGHGHRDPYPRRSGRDESDMEYGMAREDFHDRGFSSPPPRSRYRADDWEEKSMRNGPRGKQGRGYGRDGDDDEIMIRKRQRSPPRFTDPGGDPRRQDKWDRGRNSDFGYGPRRPSRAPSPEFRHPGDSRDSQETRHRGAMRRPASNEDILDEWQDRGNSPSSTRRLYYESDDWREHEKAVPTYRGRPRSPDRNEDAIALEWERPRRMKNARGEFEEDSYGRPGIGRTSSNDSVTEDWAMVDPPSRPRRPGQGRLDGPGWEVARQRRSMERRHRLPSKERRVPVDDLDRRDQIGSRYVTTKDPRERPTEITKDLVVREAIERAGYEFEETASFYYIFDYLQYDDVSALVDLSDDIREARRRRIHEMQRERTSLPPPLAAGERRPAPLMPERGHSPRRRPPERPRERELVLDDRRRRPLGRSEW